MLYLAAILFPLIAIASGIVTLYAVVRFVADVHREIQSEEKSPPRR